MNIGSRLLASLAMMFMIMGCGTAGFYNQVSSDKMSVKASDHQTVSEAGAQGQENGQSNPVDMSAEDPATHHKKPESDQKNSDPVDDTDIPSENAVALKPVVISGAYLDLNCEVLELSHSDSMQIIGCKVESRDPAVDVVSGDIQLDVYDQSGNKIVKTVVDHSAATSWDEVFEIETAHPEQLVIRGKKGDYMLPSFSFNYKKIEEYLKKLHKEGQN